MENKQVLANKLCSLATNQITERASDTRDVIDTRHDVIDLY